MQNYKKNRKLPNNWKAFIGPSRKKKTKSLECVWKGKDFVYL